jgi:KUP system potassium uptake protein
LYFYLGGEFALYSLICKHAKVSLLICKHAKVSLIPTEQSDDLEPINRQTLKEKIENSTLARWFLLMMTILGTAMVIGDGIFTPPMSG